MVRTDTLLRAILGVDALGSAEDQEREVQTATCLVELMKQLMSLRAVLTDRQGALDAEARRIAAQIEEERKNR